MYRGFLHLLKLMEKFIFCALILGTGGNGDALRANQLTGFYMIGTMVVKSLIHFRSMFAFNVLIRSEYWPEIGSTSKKCLFPVQVKFSSQWAATQTILFSCSCCIVQCSIWFQYHLFLFYRHYFNLS